MPYEPHIPDGQHLGRSRTEDGAYTGHLFDNETNDLTGHATWRWVEGSDEDYSSYEYEPPRELTPEEIERALVAAALIVLVIVKVVAVTTPLVVRLWKNKVVPAAQQRWRSARTLPARLIARVRKQPESASSETIVVLTAATVRADLADSSFTMTSAEWEARFKAMKIAGAFAEEQLRLLSGAHVVDGTVQSVNGAEQGAQQLTPQQFADRVRMMLEMNPALLSESATKELGRALEIPATLAIGTGKAVEPHSGSLAD